MDEFIPSDNIEKSSKAFTHEALQAIIDSESWHSLRPNLPSPEEDLLPQELSIEQINKIIEALMTDPSLAGYHVDNRDTEKVAMEAFEGPLDLGGIGVLTFIDNGEAKICYCLSRGDKKMAILLQSYGSELGIQIPQDPNLTKISQSPTRRLWEYSGLRTYAMLPLANNRAVKLQEFGQPATKNYMSPASGLANFLVRRSTINYIRDKLPNADMEASSNTVKELQQPRHLLTKPGYRQKVVIDIPVEERIA